MKHPPLYIQSMDIICSIAVRAEWAALSFALGGCSSHVSPSLWSNILIFRIALCHRLWGRSPNLFVFVIIFVSIFWNGRPIFPGIGQWGHYKTFEPLNCVININKFCTLYFYFYLIETIIDIWSKSSYAMFSSVLALHIFRWQWSLNIGSHFQSKNLYWRFLPLQAILRSWISEKIGNITF